MAKYCLSFLCYDGSYHVLAGDLYSNREDAEKRRDVVQPKYKHLIEVVEV